MALDLYAPCPCGSGKKFKWCCQPVHVEIDRAFRQDAEGQHAAALGLIDQVVADHPENPQAWGRKAQLLYQNDRVEEAEAALQKALDLNPNYPFGHHLRGTFRYYEGEVPGALLLLRRAAELYDPEARDAIGQVHALVGDCELKLNRPVAAHAALRVAVRCLPGDEDLRKHVEALFGPGSRLPESARREYALLAPAGVPEGDAPGKLSGLAAAFERRTQEAPESAAAWYNLGLARAWLGDNRGGLECLDRYVGLEPDEDRAAAAWALAEVLRCGHGMDEFADHHEYSVLYQFSAPEPVIDLLRELDRSRRMVTLQAQQEGAFAGIVLDLEAPSVITAGVAPARSGKLGAYLMVVENLLRLSGPRKEALERVRKEVQQRAGMALSPPRERTDPIQFGDVVAEAVLFPANVSSDNEAADAIRAHAGQYFENVWAHQPLKSLGQVAPADAAGHGTLRKKLKGMIRFLQECAADGIVQVYDFDALRGKLGLPAAAAATGAGGPDVRSMGAAELAALSADTMTEEQLEQAYQAAKGLDARDLSAHFARALVARPPSPERPDRYPWYSFLVQQALAEGNTDLALETLGAGERADLEHNEGRHGDDYAVRRAQVHARRGEAEAAQDVFDRLIARDPSEMRFRMVAAEVMLGMRDGRRALRFAEEGLERARQQNDRDSEQNLMELAAAARKATGL